MKLRRSESDDVALAVARVRSLLAPSPSWVPPAGQPAQAAASGRPSTGSSGEPAVDLSTVEVEYDVDGDSSPPERQWPTRRARIDPGRRSTLAFIATAVASAVIAGGATWLSRPTAEPVAASAASVVAVTVATSAAPLSPAEPTPTPVVKIVVSVVGKVVKPGLVTLPLGARISDALAACGGPLPGTDTTSLNLAQKLTDGQQVAVGIPGSAGAGGVSGAGEGSTNTSGGPPADPSTPINLNTATAQQLEALPGIGPVLAQRIIDFRVTNGPFKTVDDLGEVPGVGPSILGQVRSLVTV